MTPQDRLQRGVSSKGEVLCCVEECADSDPSGLNADLQLTNTTVEMDCATGVHVTRSGEYINQSDILSD